MMKISQQLQTVFDNHLKALEKHLQDEDYETAISVIEGSARSLDILENKLNFSDAEKEFVEEIKEHWDIVLAKCHKELGSYH